MVPFYERRGADYVATGRTRGPWAYGFQHGGPPAALLTGAFVRFGMDAEQFQLARVTVEIVRPVPIGVLQLEVRPVLLGRQVQRLEGVLVVDGKEVMRASGLRVLRTEGPPEQVAPAVDSWAEPESLEPFHFDFFEWEDGYHRAVDLRLTHGAWGRTPVGFWTRPTAALVDDEAMLPEERVVLLADAQSGMGTPLDPDVWSFVNPDITVYFGRKPVGEWIGFDIRSMAGPGGLGLAQSGLRDALGELGRSAQSLVVTPER